MTEANPDANEETEIAEDSPRTTVSQQGEFDTIDIEGVAAESVVVDHDYEPPRLLVHADENEEPTHVINLSTSQS